MQVTKGTWHMREQCVPGSLSSSHAREPGNEASASIVMVLGESEKAGCLARGLYLTQFALVANFSLWFMFILIHTVAT